MNESNTRFPVLRLRLKAITDFFDNLFFTPKKEEHVVMGLLNSEEEQAADVTFSADTANTATRVTRQLNNSSPLPSAPVEKPKPSTFLSDVLNALVNAFSLHGQSLQPVLTPSPSDSASPRELDVVQVYGDLSTTAVEATAKNSAFAHIAAFFLAIGNAIAQAFQSYAASLPPAATDKDYVNIARCYAPGVYFGA